MKLPDGVKKPEKCPACDGEELRTMKTSDLGLVFFCLRCKTVTRAVTDIKIDITWDVD